MPLIVGVKFKSSNKIYSFNAGSFEFAEGDGVIVETAKGIEFGTIVHEVKEVEESKLRAPLKDIIRKATQEDYDTYKKLEEKKPEATKVAIEKIAKHKLDMKLVDTEFTFDGNKVIFYFTADGRVDFRELVRDLASHFKIRIELRQIGIRDECKMLGGIAPCGRACCCSAHMPDFGHVSIKMAKNQGLSLNPTKISGLCGRLMCCLEYENAHYVQTAKKMPKLGADVKTPDGTGVAVANNMLKEIVRVKLPSKDGFEYKEYTMDKIDVSGKTAADDIDDSVDDESIRGLED